MSVTNTAKGTRDFSKEQIGRRNFIFNRIRSTYEKYGFEPLETPTIEKIETLTGKYGEEGDQLLFRVLRSGDFLRSVQEEDLHKDNIRGIRNAIVDKGLRYDLTIPFARFIAKNHQVVGLPYKRYQIQPVWRADRPAKGRYREFFQCDGDVAGSKSLMSDAEFIPIVDEVFDGLKLPKSVFKLNNRKILAGLAATLSKENGLVDMTTAVDKLDKIGIDGVEKELVTRGFSEEDIERIKNFIAIEGSNEEKLEKLGDFFDNDNEAQQGLLEVKEVLSYVTPLELKNTSVEVDFSLARGLNYYTGTIFEVALTGVSMGSVASGGRYDNLTESFGVKDVPGVGLSFGAERLYDVMEQLNLFPTELNNPVQVLIINFNTALNPSYFKLAHQLRNAGISAELYLHKAKIGKQMKFADQRNIPYVIIAGETEFESGAFQLKNLESGVQLELSLSELLKHLSEAK